MDQSAQKMPYVWPLGGMQTAPMADPTFLNAYPAPPPVPPPSTSYSSGTSYSAPTTQLMSPPTAITYLSSGYNFPPLSHQNQNPPYPSSEGSSEHISSNANSKAKGRRVIDPARAACTRCARLKMRCELISPEDQSSSSSGKHRQCKRCEHSGDICVWRESGRGRWKRPEKGDKATSKRRTKAPRQTHSAELSKSPLLVADAVDKSRRKSTSAFTQWTAAGRPTDPLARRHEASEPPIRTHRSLSDDSRLPLVSHHDNGSLPPWASDLLNNPQTAPLPSSSSSSSTAKLQDSTWIDLPPQYARSSVEQNFPFGHQGNPFSAPPHRPGGLHQPGPPSAQGEAANVDWLEQFCDGNQLNLMRFSSRSTLHS